MEIYIYVLIYSNDVCALQRESDIILIYIARESSLMCIYSM